MTPPKRLTRSVTDRFLGGVCGGLAQYFNVDATLVRIGVVALAALTAFLPFLIAYVVAWMIVPQEF